MGWASGSELAEEIWDIVKKYIPKNKKKKVAKQLVEAFEDRDCDTMCEAEELFKVAGYKGYL